MWQEFQLKTNSDLNLLTKDESAKTDRQFLSMTDGVTCYRLPRIEDAKIDFILNIIDTPGFGDTRGKSFDENIPKLIESMFNDVIESVDAICLVIPISCVRLTENQRYIFESVSTLFGKDIEHNILVCITFDDGGNPSVLDALKEAKIPHQKEIFFRFNNSDLFIESPSVESWNKRENNFKNFFKHLRKVRTQSVSTSREVMDTRKSLQIQLQYIKKNVREQQRILKENEDKINANKDFTYTELISVTERNYSHTWCLNCPYCEKTCHDGCWSFGYVFNWTCEVMDFGKSLNCKCNSIFHTNEKFRYNTKRVEVQKTNEDLKKEYEKFSKEAVSTMGMLAVEKKKLIKKLQELDDLFSKIKRLISNLETKALLPNTMTLDGYIDQIIKEEDPRKPEAFDTVQILEKLKDKIRQNEKLQDLIKDLINI